MDKAVLKRKLLGQLLPHLGPIGLSILKFSVRQIEKKLKISKTTV